MNPYKFLVPKHVWTALIHLVGRTVSLSMRWYKNALIGTYTPTQHAFGKDLAQFRKSLEVESKGALHVIDV